MTADREFSWEPPAESGRQWIEIELDHPVNPWEHDGAGSISWGAHLDRSAPLGEEAVSIIKEAWEQRGKHPRDPADRQQQEPEPVERDPAAAASIKPGWASRIDIDQYWIHLSLHQPLNERWEEQAGENWSRGELINDGVIKRSVTVEATTRLGHRALRIIDALHSAHPYDELDPPDGDERYR